MPDGVADSLREMALHRGMKLVKSRRRKPGTGDFGKFGLTDDNGTELIGFGDDGQLTASADEIQAYLRAGAMSTWKQSASVTPDRPATKPARKTDPGEVEPAIRPRGRNRSPDPQNDAPTKKASTRSIASSGDRLEKASPAVGKAEGAAEPAPPRERPKLEIVRNDAVLSLRPAKPADASAIAKLLAGLNGADLDSAKAERRIADVRKAGGGTHVAEMGKLIGCISWILVPTLQHGMVGRITVLFVDEGHRRRRIGTQLLAAAEAALRKKGAADVEAMSDIDLKNSHNFFRSSNFNQTSYRFARTIDGGLDPGPTGKKA